MKLTLFALLLCACCFLMGCPLQTDYPIQGSDVKNPSWLAGKWTKMKDGDPTTTSYKVTQAKSGFPKVEIVSLNEQGKADESATARKAELALVDGFLYISVFEEGDDVDASGYYHYRIEHQGKNDLILITPLKEHIVSTSTTGKELAAFISSHKEDEYLNKEDAEKYQKRK